jgi:hypothetical protein
MCVTEKLSVKLRIHNMASKYCELIQKFNIPARDIIRNYSK